MGKHLVYKSAWAVLTGYSKPREVNWAGQVECVSSIKWRSWAAVHFSTFGLPLGCSSKCEFAKLTYIIFPLSVEVIHWCMWLRSNTGYIMIMSTNLSRYDVSVYFSIPPWFFSVNKVNFLLEIITQKNIFPSFKYYSTFQNSWHWL